MLTVEKYNNFLECLFTLDGNYMYSEDYSVYAKNHAKYNRIQFMIRDYPCLKELKEAWSDLRKTKDENARVLAILKLKEIENKIITPLVTPEEPCSV